MWYGLCLWCEMSNVIPWFLFVVWDVKCDTMVSVCDVRCQMWYGFCLWRDMSDVIWFLFVVWDVKCDVMVSVCDVRCQMWCQGFCGVWCQMWYHGFCLWCLKSGVVLLFMFVVWDVKCDVMIYVCCGCEIWWFLFVVDIKCDVMVSVCVAVKCDVMV